MNEFLKGLSECFGVECQFYYSILIETVKWITKKVSIAVAKRHITKKSKSCADNFTYYIWSWQHESYSPFVELNSKKLIHSKITNPFAEKMMVYLYKVEDAI